MTEPSKAHITQAVPFFGVRDMQVSLKFYLDGLGFVFRHKWIPEGSIKWCWLQLDEAAIMLQEFDADRVPSGSLGTGVSINFMCKDAIAFYQDVRSRSIDAQKPFVGNSLWVTSVSDPDGYILFFESPTDAPEESEYEED